MAIEKSRAIQRILDRKSFSDALPAFGTPVSVAVRDDGKLVAFEADFVDAVIGFSKQPDGYFLASYEPTGDEAKSEKLVISYVNAQQVATISWSPDDEPGKLSVVPDVAEDEPAWVNMMRVRPDVPDYVPPGQNENVEPEISEDSDESESVDKLRGVMDEAIAASPRAAIVSQLSSNPGLAALRDAARSVSWLTK